MKKAASKKKALPKKVSAKKKVVPQPKIKRTTARVQKNAIQIESVSFTLGGSQRESASVSRGLPKGVLLPGLSFGSLGARGHDDDSDSERTRRGGRRAGGMGTRAIIGDDDRQRVPNTRELPYPWICYLEFSSPRGIGMIGTGWLIGPKTVVTAGHCIYSREEYDNQGNQVGVGPMKRYRVRAGVNAELGDALAEAGVTDMATTKQWIDQGMTAYDFGVLYLDKSIGDEDELGHFSFGTLDQGDEEALVCVAGYPYDKQVSRNGSMWADVNRVSSITDQQLGYQVDTLGGHSGAPVIFADGQGNFTAVGIHNYGGDTENYATRINEQVAAQLQQWKR